MNDDDEMERPELLRSIAEIIERHGEAASGGRRG
jgi:hypothetical protein